MYRRLRVGAVLIAASLLCGCATVGPRVSSQEIQAASDELKVKGLLRTAEQQKRIWQIGHTLIAALPSDKKEGLYPELGLVVGKIDKVARKAFNYQDRQDGIYVLAARDGGPAAASGVQQGDIILALDGQPCVSTSKFLTLAGKFSPGSAHTLQVKRAEQKIELPLTIGSRSIKVEFIVSHGQDVNAWAKGHEIGVTSGLVRFIESDDEMAVVLGHELAHITGSHRAKTIGTHALSSVLGLALGVAMELAAPGAGNAVMNSTTGLADAAFSRGFEREADYRGLLHTYRGHYDVEAGIAVWERFGTDIPETLTASLRSSHPSSPERMVRIRKIAQSLKEIGLEETIAKYESSESETPEVAGETPAVEVAVSAQNPIDTQPASLVESR